MRRINFEVPGKPADVLKVIDVEKPIPTAEEVLIKVGLSPINPSDVMFIQDLYGIRPQLPSPAGFEGYGIIESVGEEVRIPVGTRVSFRGMGAWGEYVCVHKTMVIPVPDAMPDEFAAQLFVNPFTAVVMVEESGVKAGEWLMITACGSALGKAVVQLCKMKGIKTIGTVRRNDLIDELKALGADEVINVKEENLEKRVKEITGKGVRGVLECIGGTDTEEALKCLGRGGLMLIYGLMSLDDPKINVGLMIFKELQIKGFWLTDWLKRASPEDSKRVAKDVITFLSTGQIQLPVEAYYGLDEISKAATHADSPGRWGKVLVKP